MKNLEIFEEKGEIKSEKKTKKLVFGLMLGLMLGSYFLFGDTALAAEQGKESQPLEATESAEVHGSAEAGEEMPIMHLGNAVPDKSALGVSPAIIELVLEPGGVKEKSITVFNVTNFPLPVKGSAESFFVVEDVEQEARDIFDVSLWITIEPADFILQPQEKKEIQITIDVPGEAEPGGHYASLYFQPLIPEQVLSPQTAFLTARVGALGFFVVRGEITEKASLESLEVKKFRQFGPVDFKAPIVNQGNVHILPSGELTVTDILGREVKKIKLTPTAVLPRTTKKLEATWDKKFLLGKFKVQAKVSYGSENRELISDPTVFWVVPWLPLSVGGGLLTFLAVFCIMFRKRVVLAVRVLFGSEGAEKRKER